MSYLKSGSIQVVKPNKIGKSEINYRKIIENWHHDRFCFEIENFLTFGLEYALKRVG